MDLICTMMVRYQGSGWVERGGMGGLGAAIRTRVL